LWAQLSGHGHNIYKRIVQNQSLGQSRRFAIEGSAATAFRREAPVRPSALYAILQIHRPFEQRIVIVVL
jgi:hypothetical protein